MRNTVFSVINGTNVAIGETVEVKVCDGAAGQIAKVYYHGDEVGAISMSNGGKNGVKILLPNTTALSRDDIAKQPKTWTAKVVDQGTIFHGQPKNAIAIEYVAAWEKTTGNRTPQQGDVTLTFKVQGATGQNPGKVKVIAALNQGDDAYLSMSLEQKNGENQVVMNLNGEKAGFIPASTESDYSMLVELLNSGVALEGKAFGQTATSYQVKILISGKAAADAAMNAAKSVNLSKKQKIVAAGGPSMDTLDRIEVLLLDYGATAKQVGFVFDTIRPYPAELQYRIIQKLDRPYKDIDGHMMKAVCAFLAHKPLLLVGPAGGGKNELLKTLAFIFQRPYFDMSINAQTDKYDLLGSKKIETEETDSGEIVQRVVFEPELLVTAMEVGGICNMDELNFSNAGVVGILHPIADDRKAVEVPGFRKVVADENFQLTATMNKGYEGTHELNKALNQRYLAIKINVPDSIVSILEEACPYASKKDINICEKIFKKIQVAQGDRTLDIESSARNFINALSVAQFGLSLKDSLVMSLANSINDDDYEKAILELIEMNCPN